MIETKNDAFDEIAKKKYKTKEEINEAWLRWYVYGNIDEITDCNLYQTVFDGDAYKETFPSAFALELVNHIAKCDNCYKTYFESMEKYNSEEL